MKSKPSRKKIIAAGILTTGIAFAITDAALAKPNSWRSGKPPCQIQEVDPVVKKAQEKFLTETAEIRKQMAEKKAAMRALMSAETPNPNQASQVAGELFDLREQLRVKAAEYGLPAEAYASFGKHCRGVTRK